MDTATLAVYEALLRNKTCHSWVNDGPVDCLKSTGGACRAAGCTWIAGYAGPWCQFPVPEHCIPSKLGIIWGYVEEEFSNISSLHFTAALLGLVSVLVCLVLMFWADRRQSHETRARARQDHLKDDDDSNLPIGNPSKHSSSETAPISRDYTISLNTVRRRKAAAEDLEDGDQPSLISPRGVAAALNRRSRSRSSSAGSATRAVDGPWYRSTDAICSAVLFVLSMALHLWRLEEPPSLTYDECHFGYFTSKYFKREYTFDIHPPLAKITFWLLGSLLGHDPGPDAVFPFKGQMGTAYHNIYQFYPLRFIASFFGALVVPLMYLSCRALRIAPSTAIMGASLVLWETCLLGESRTILTDSQLIFWNALTILCMLKLFTSAESGAASSARGKWIAATAVCCGCVFGVKFTALATLGVVVVEAFWGLFALPRPLTLAQCAGAVALGFAVWMAIWYVHFARLTHNHSEVGWQDAEFQASLIGNENYGRLTPPSFPYKTLQLVLTMIRVNSETLEPHNWGSPWYRWVIGRASRVLSAHEGRWEISIVTNPCIILLTLLALAVGLAVVVLFWRYRDDAASSGHRATRLGALARDPVNRAFCSLVALCIFGWLANLLPYIFIARSTFVYHYLPGLLYAQLLVAILCDRVWQSLNAYRLTRVLVNFSLCVFMMLGWLYFAPWIYALPLTDMQHAGRRLVLGK